MNESKKKMICKKNFNKINSCLKIINIANLLLSNILEGFQDFQFAVPGYVEH